MSYDAKAYELARDTRSAAAASLAAAMHHVLDNNLAPPECAVRWRVYLAEYDAADAAIDRALGLPEVTR